MSGSKAKKEKIKENEEEELEKEKTEEKPEDEKCNKAESKVEPEMEKKKDEEDDEDLSDLNDDEKKSYRALKSKVKKRLIKSDGSGVDPVQSGAQSQTDQHTVSPGAGTPSGPQNVFVPDGGPDIGREQSTPMGKSATIDLTKSPLYNEIQKQFDGITKKFDQIAKSLEDRFNNINKAIEGIEKMSLYKAAATETPVAPKEETFNEKLAKGAVMYRNK